MQHNKWAASKIMSGITDGAVIGAVLAVALIGAALAVAATGAVEKRRNASAFKELDETGQMRTSATEGMHELNEAARAAMEEEKERDAARAAMEEVERGCDGERGADEFQPDGRNVGGSNGGRGK